ncbi:hypothetical protein [Jonesia quinghaiensis]|uniref:hypothetical protein n=1 Tax=Jonesia quinghaiensis TaxID=262806 RepID=UPI00040A8537|nr:hypothetical protein [Jonesia quinghaiensis]
MSLAPDITARPLSSQQSASPARGVTPSTPRKPSLEVISAPDPRRSLGMFLTGCLLLLGITIGAILVLNVEMAHGAYEQTDLKASLSRAVLDTEQLSSEIDDLSTAENLAKQAKELGMIQMLTPGVIRLQDGTILVEPSGKQ